jgi:acyl dehydratase
MSTGARQTSPGPGLFFEDIEVGDAFDSPGRTITETDMVMWSYLTGDWTPIHCDEEFAKEHSIFGTRRPPGLMAVAIGHGLLAQLNLFNRTGRAFLEMTVRYKAPLFVGDTVRARLVVAEKRPTKHQDRGLVRFGYLLLNQKGEVLQESEWTILLARRTERAPE